jgi:UBX domain
LYSERPVQRHNHGLLFVLGVKEEPGGEEAVVEVALRLPGGAMARRRFPGNAPSSSVYDWAMTLDDLFQEDRASVGLYEPFPRRKLRDDAETLQEAQLVPRTLLSVTIEK